MIKNIQKTLDNCGFVQYGIIDTDAIEFSNEVRKMCEANTCRQYGKTWACPPAIGTVEECKQRCLKFKNMAIFSCKYELEDSFDYEGMTKGMNDFKQVATKLHSLIRGSSLKEYLILSNEGCGLCVSCTYPDSPCRFPDKVHGAIEGYGIFVNEIAKLAGINYINGVNTVTYFGALLFG